MKNIAVFFGGTTVEHDISVITGVLTVNSLDGSKYNGVPVYIHTDGLWYTGESLKDLDDYKSLDLKKLQRVTVVAGKDILYRVVKDKKIKPICKISTAINCLHGERGEDGSLAGLLAMCEIPLVSPPLLPSAVSIDKCFTKTVMKGLKIKTLPSVTVRSGDDLKRVTQKLKYPVIIKPACLGSSVGIYKAENDAELYSGVAGALRFGEKVIVEPKISGYKEINCAGYYDGEKVVISECERPVGKCDFLSFNDKYTGGERIFPADIPKNISDRIKAITEKVYLALGFNGVIRIDYFVKGEEIYLNEINSVPGSLAFYLFSDTLCGFSDMLDKMVSEAEVRYARSTTLKRNYSSGILTFGGSKGAKGKKR
ncbi:MAG: ATP-grasp domain-containing protein [Clostridia bacterium]|nr:ATP-grasp domain-containing protein [Clostridia bacterium]